MSKRRYRLLIYLFVAIGLLIVVVAFLWQASVGSLVYDVSKNVASANLIASSTAPTTTPAVIHLPTPKAVKAIYMSQCVAGTPSFREKLVKIARETEVNAIVIDVKDFSGGLGFTTDNPALKASVSQRCRAGDMKEFIEYLHKNNIYAIARVTVFQDPLYTKNHPDQAIHRASDGGVWRDRKGLSFVDVGSKPFWDYIVTVAKESYALGFDEVNFDYIRFPSDGNMRDITYPLAKLGVKLKHEALDKFFTYLDIELRQKSKIPISADLFGMVTTNTDDLGIGQVLEDALSHFDYVAPMVYPSHYPSGFNGWKKPATAPYELIKFTMDAAVRRADALAVNTASSTKPISQAAMRDKLRPWLQDFDMGADYTAPMVRAQIKATYDVGLDSWMLWDPKNLYTKGALLPEAQVAGVSTEDKR